MHPPILFTRISFVLTVRVVPAVVAKAEPDIVRKRRESALVSNN
ncbi:MAG: hypothetical protein WBC71_04580 [Salaquimonas sp.]